MAIGYKPRRKGRSRMVDLLVAEAKRIARMCADVGHDEVELKNYCKIQERAQQEWLSEFPYPYEDDDHYYYRKEEWEAEEQYWREMEEYHREKEDELESRYPRWMTRRDYEEEEYQEELDRHLKHWESLYGEDDYDYYRGPDEEWDEWWRRLQWEKKERARRAKEEMRRFRKFQSRRPTWLKRRKRRR